MNGLGENLELVTLNADPVEEIGGSGLAGE
jgi:hypothetical protein